jgi:hypothetical protein
VVLVEGEQQRARLEEQRAQLEEGVVLVRLVRLSRKGLWERFAWFADSTMKRGRQELLTTGFGDAEEAQKVETK